MSKGEIVSKTPKKNKKQTKRIPTCHIYFDVGSRINRPEGVDTGVMSFRRG